MSHPRFMAIARAGLDVLARAHDIAYADVRVVELERGRMALGNEGEDRAATSSNEHARGLCARVLSRGAWGVVTTAACDQDAAVAAMHQAAARARDAASQESGPHLCLAEEEPQIGHYQTPIDIDPFAVTRERRVAQLHRVLAAVQDHGDTGVIEARAILSWERTDSVFCSTEGSRIGQRLITSGAGLEVTVAGPDGPVQRSWPGRGEMALYRAGHEIMDELDLETRAAGLVADALALARAPLCPADTTTLIVDSTQLAVQIRESCAIPSLWTHAEPALAPLEQLGRARVGSTHVNLSADSLGERGAATCGWDDEGVPARVTPLVARGVVVGYQTSRATAERAGLGRSSGSMRAPSSDQAPGLCTINVLLEPDPNGPSTLDELVADTRQGVLMSTSAGARRKQSTHIFACEAAWQIAGGKRVRLLRAPMYSGTATELWRSCDAVANQHAWRLLGLWADGTPRGPAAGFGCAPARFRNIRIGT